MERRELRVTREARKVFIAIHKHTNKHPEFKYTLNPQIIRSAISIGSNIEEGRARGDKEFIRYLMIAEGSAREALFQLSLYPSDTQDIENMVDITIGMIVNLLKAQRTRLLPQ